MMLKSSNKTTTEIFSLNQLQEQLQLAIERQQTLVSSLNKTLPPSLSVLEISAETRQCFYQILKPIDRKNAENILKTHLVQHFGYKALEWILVPRNPT